MKKVNSVKIQREIRREPIRLKWLNQKGYSTIFFAIMSLIFIGVFSLLAGTLMNLMQSNEQMRQASLASRTVLSYYDDQLEADYGIMAYSKEAVKADAIFSPYFKNEWRITPTAHLGELSSFQEQALALGKISLAEKGINELSGALKSDSEDSATDNNGKAVSNEWTKTAAGLETGGDLSETEDSGLSKDEKKRARKIKNRLNKPASRSWSTQSGGEIEAEMYEKRYQFDGKSAKSLNLKDRAILVAYLETYFNNYAQWKTQTEGSKNGKARCFQGGELEYVLEGQRLSSNNQMLINSKIFIVREGVNLIHIVKSQEKMTITASLASLVCALFPLGEPIVQAGLVTLWASVESGYEVSLLLEGKSIPAIKLDGGDWYTDLETGGAQTPITSKTDKLNQINYEGFLTIFLMAQKDAITAERTMTLIELNLKKSGHDLKRLDQMVTRHEVWVKGKTGKETSFEDGYLQNKASKGKSQH